MPGDVQTRIRAITARHSLLPTSQARTTIGMPCSMLSRRMSGAVRGFHVSLVKYAGLGACYRPGDMWTTATQPRDVAPASNTFWSSASTTCACYYSRSLSQVQIPSPFQLSSTHPACGCQEGCPLAILSPEAEASFVPLSGQLFIHARRFAR